MHIPIWRALSWLKSVPCAHKKEADRVEDEEIPEWVPQSWCFCRERAELKSGIRGLSVYTCIYTINKYAYSIMSTELQVSWSHVIFFPQPWDSPPQHHRLRNRPKVPAEWLSPVMGDSDVSDVYGDLWLERAGSLQQAVCDLCDVCFMKVNFVRRALGTESTVKQVLPHVPLTRLGQNDWNHVQWRWRHYRSLHWYPSRPVWSHYRFVYRSCGCQRKKHNLCQETNAINLIPQKPWFPQHPYEWGCCISVQRITGFDLTLIPFPSLTFCLLSFNCLGQKLSYLTKLVGQDVSFDLPSCVLGHWRVACSLCSSGGGDKNGLNGHVFFQMQSNMTCLLRWFGPLQTTNNIPIASNNQNC